MNWYRLVIFAHLNILFNQTQLTQTYFLFRTVVVKHVWSKLKIRTPSKVLKTGLSITIVRMSSLMALLLLTCLLQNQGKVNMWIILTCFLGLAGNDRNTIILLELLMGGIHASNELQELGLPIISFWGKYSLYIKLLHAPFLNMQI